MRNQVFFDKKWHILKFCDKKCHILTLVKHARVQYPCKPISLSRTHSELWALWAIPLSHVSFELRDWLTRPLLGSYRRYRGTTLNATLADVDIVGWKLTLNSKCNIFYFRLFYSRSGKGADIRVAESVVTLLRHNEPSKDLVSQSLSSKLTCEREMAQKALELLLTAQNAFERERDQLTRLLNSCSQLRF